MAQLTHVGLLTLMIVMPLSGYLWSTAHGHDVAPFHLLHFPRVAFNRRPIGDFAEKIHLIGRWFVYGLIALHLGGVSYHVIVKRDALLARMLPAQAFKQEGADR
jgi:cytochrome b561